jgi:hypothetical protein
MPIFILSRFLANFDYSNKILIFTEPYISDKYTKIFVVKKLRIKNI